MGVIDFADVGFDYGGPPLFAGVSLSLAPGSFHFLTGPSGAGKSTVVRLCTAAIRPSLGTVQIFERDVAGLSRDEAARLRRRIGAVHQDCRFLDHLSVAENVALPLVVSGQAEDATALGDLLGWVGLAQRREAKPAELSGGERQRAALARAVILAPDLILADEPTGNLDWDMSVRVMSLLVELNRMGRTVLVATHDLALIRWAKAQTAVRVLRIKDRAIKLAAADL